MKALYFIIILNPFTYSLSIDNGTIFVPNLIEKDKKLKVGSGKVEEMIDGKSLLMIKVD